jgi:hypothetical protein
MDLNWQPATPEPDHEPDGTPHAALAPALAPTSAAAPEASAPAAPSDPTPAVRATGIRRLVATAALTLGLLAVGGVSVVMAASPAPSSSSTPSTQHNGTHNCPNMGTNGSGGTSG